MSDTLTVTEEHVKLLRHAVVDWGDCEFGAPAIDCKRPYGNSSVLQDIGEIIGAIPSIVDGEEVYTDDDEERFEKLHKETQDALQIFLVAGVMKTGTYTKTDKYDCFSWVWVKGSR